MSEVERLTAINEIMTLKARYCRLVDTKQWDAFRALFVDDARFENPGANFSVDSADAFLDVVRRELTNAVTMHHCHNGDIELLGPDEAVGTWAMEDRINRPEGEGDSVHGFGHYEERYKKVDGAWLFADIKLLYLFQDPEWVT